MPLSHARLWASSAIAMATLTSTVIAQVGIEQQKLTARDGAAGDEFGISQGLDGDTLVLGADQKNSRQGAVYVFTRQPDGTWAELQQITASDGAAGHEFGYSVGVSGNWIAVGARLEDVNKDDAGAVYMFLKQGGIYTEMQKLRPNDWSSYDHFGSALEIQGTRLVVGAPRNDDDGADSGSTYVFDESGGTWTQSAELRASNAEAGDLFPHTISLDGDRIVCSTIYDDSFTGTAYVFEHQGGGSWIETRLLTASDKSQGDQFGFALALSGNQLLVSARLEDGTGAQSGSVYSFEHDGVDWNETDKFTGNDTVAGDHFGSAMDLDGTRAVVSSNRASPGGIMFAGKTHLFERQSGGTWVQVAQLLVTDPAPTDYQGWATDLDGHRVAVTAVLDDEIGVDAGAAYVAEGEFLRSADGISVSTGGTVDHHVNLGVTNAGAEYWVLGSYTGITPGIFLGVPVPLNWDLYFRMTITNANVPPFSNSRGVLDANGSATFSITAPGGLDPSLVGLELHHAALTFDSATGTYFTGASNPTSIVFKN